MDAARGVTTPVRKRPLGSVDVNSVTPRKGREPGSATAFSAVGPSWLTPPPGPCTPRSRAPSEPGPSLSPPALEDGAPQPVLGQPPGWAETADACRPPPAEPPAPSVGAADRPGAAAGEDAAGITAEDYPPVEGYFPAPFVSGVDEYPLEPMNIEVVPEPTLPYCVQDEADEPAPCYLSDDSQ
eukprot:TRINITY_DN49883_c0_g1_i1.p1 TRINITY_DN49883_c0_g1~~TRINITY_DN49883_c0_g1_i1.p1  ORF type:complete len:209 (+),score=44.64 TRINITY_DN49883_c0_g1_i1:80-628(+)